MTRVSGRMTSVCDRRAVARTRRASATGGPSPAPAERPRPEGDPSPVPAERLRPEGDPSPVPAERLRPYPTETLRLGGIASAVKPEYDKSDGRILYAWPGSCQQ